MLAVPQSDRAGAAEIRNRRANLLPELYRHPGYATDLTYWDAWYATEHDVRRCGRRPVRPRGVLVVADEDQAAEATYQAPLEEAR